MSRLNQGSGVLYPAVQFTEQEDSQHSEEDTSHFWESNDKVIRTSKARYAKGQVAVHIKSNDTGYKHRGHRLADHLNARYSGRENVYILSPTKSKKLKELYESGHDASGYYGSKLIPPTQKDNQ